MPAAVFKAALGNTFNNVSGTTLALTTTAAIAIGDLVVVRWAADNLSATTPTATCADGSANTYTVQRQAAANATAAAGIAGGILTSQATAAVASGGTITLTFSGAITGKAAYAESFTNVVNTTRVAAVGSSAASGTAATSGASAAGILAGDLVLGFSAVQSRTAATGDADTTNGSWSAKVGVNGGATTGQDTGSVQINGQYKIPTAGGAQTYDNTVTSTYWLTGLVVMQQTPNPAITQAAYQFFADGTETASTALAAENTAYTADVTAGDVNLLVRTRLQLTTAVATNATDDWQLQYEKNASGTWINVVSQLMSDSYSFGATAFQFSATNTAVGESIMGNGQRLVNVQSDLFKTGTPPGNALCQVYAHSGTFGSGGIPTGSPLATSASIACTALASAAGTFLSFNFDGSFMLVAGTPYFLVFTTDTVQVASNFVTANKGTGGVPSSGNGAELISGTWSAVTPDYNFICYTISDVAAINSANLTDAAATTNRLTAGTGTFVAGKVSEDGLVDDLGWSASNYTELLYAVKMLRVAFASGDTLRFRVLYNGATTLMTYTQTPTLNITKVGGPVALAGSASGVSTTTSDTAITRGLAATVAGLSTAAASTPAVTRLLVGAAGGLSTATATLTTTPSGGFGPPERMLPLDYAPTGQNNADFTLGSSFLVNTAGQVTHIRYYNGGAGETHNVHLWTMDGVMRATSIDTAAPVGWREVPLPSPYPVAAGISYLASFSSGGGTGTYTYSATTPASATPNLTGPNGWYLAGQDVFPTTPANDGTNFYNYLVDVVYQAVTVAGQAALAGEADGAATTTADVGVTRGLGASAAGVSTTTAALARGVPLAVTVAGTSTAVASTPVLALPLVASVSGTSTTTAATAVARALASTIAGLSTTTAALGAAIPLAGTVAGSSTTTAALSRQVSLAATVAGTSTVISDLYIAGIQQMVATVTGGSTVTAALGVDRPLVAQVNGTSTTTVALGLAIALSGTTAGGTAPFDPRTITGMSMWLDASQLGLPDGADVAIWPDLSGSNQVCTLKGSPAPKVRANVLNGLPVVRTTISEGRFRWTSTGVTTSWTVVYLGRMATANMGRVLTGIYSPCNLLIGFWNGFEDVFYDEGFTTPDTRVPQTTNWKLYSADGLPTPLTRCFRNDDIGVSTSMGTTTTGIGWFGTFAISGYDPDLPSETCDAEVAEVCFYNRRLTGTERIQVENYLRTKWLLAPVSAGPGSTASATTLDTVRAPVVLVAASVGVGSTTGALAVARTLAAASTGVATVTAAGAVTRGLASGSAGVATTTSALAVARALVTRADGIGTTAATLIVAVRLVAGAAGVSTNTASLFAGAAGTMQAFVQGTSTASGALAVARPLAGSAAGVSTDTSALAIARALVASSAGASTATNAVTVNRGLFARSDGVATTTGSFVINRSLAAQGAGVAFVTGTLTVSPRVALAGSASGLATASATTLSSGVLVEVWNGSDFVAGVVKVWDGSAFVDPVSLKVWNGTTFVQTR